MNHISLFSGIGGFDLAADWMGWNNIAHCEWNPFGQKVLKHYWPNAISYHDITKTDFTIHRGNIDIVTGGFPCQPYSAAGKRLGKEDDRHLWPEMLRAIREIQPSWVVGENVRGLTNWNGGLVFDEVQAELEAQGYEVLPFLLPACAVDAPHRRDRIWFIAYSFGNRYTSCRKSKCAERNRSENHGKPKERIEQAKWVDGLYGLSRDATNSKSCPGNIPTQSRIGEEKLHVDGNGAVGDVADAQSKGSRGKLQQRQEEREFGGCDSINESFTDPNSNERRERRMHPSGPEATERHFGPRDARGHERGDWQNFPTQSPICSGNDGISARLDGITFPKWRNESIKAGGNAIVPQVAHQIFKAIKEYISSNPCTINN